MNRWQYRVTVRKKCAEVRIALDALVDSFNEAEELAGFYSALGYGTLVAPARDLRNNKVSRACGNFSGHGGLKSKP